MRGNAHSSDNTFYLHFDILEQTIQIMPGRYLAALPVAVIKEFLHK